MTKTVDEHTRIQLRDLRNELLVEREAHAVTKGDIACYENRAKRAETDAAIEIGTLRIALARAEIERDEHKKANDWNHTHYASIHENMLALSARAEAAEARVRELITMVDVLMEQQGLGKLTAYTVAALPRGVEP